MDINLGRIEARHKDGAEPFCLNGRPLAFKLLDFWCWACSDLNDNTWRGILAKFIVARAIGASTAGAYDTWGPFDLKLPDGRTVQVKTSGRYSSWNQKTKSRLSFGIGKKRAWDSKLGGYVGKPKRHADLYVFAILDPGPCVPIDPLNLDQWRFCIVETATLDSELGNQQNATLSTLQRRTDCKLLTYFELEREFSQTLFV